MTAVLEARGLTKAFGGLVALNDVSFDLSKGEVLALIGPNGAGKSTCFNVLTGQLKPTAGVARLNGKVITGKSPRRIWRGGIGRTFQITATYSSMTVAENVQMALISHRGEALRIAPYATRLHRDDAQGLLNRVGMIDQADRHCAVLAYGDLKRLELAVALAHEPKVLLMDEPTAGMAPQERSELMELTTDIVAERGMSILFTEHDMDVVFSHAHRVMVLDRGELIAEGDPEAIRSNALVRAVYLGSGTLAGKEPQDA